MSQDKWNRLREWAANQGTPDVLLSRTIQARLNREAREMGLTRRQLDEVLSGAKG